MKNILFTALLLSCFIFLTGCGDGKKYHDESPVLKEIPRDNHIASIIEFQNGLNKEFSDPETSPLPDRYRKDFNGLDFFEPDTAFIVNARFERTPEAIPFLMPTSTDRLSKEVVYGIVTFEINGSPFRLEVYQNEELKTQEGFEDYLFLPFTDETNGKQTYSGGRYIDLRFPDDTSLTIDFNKAYNPYCAYNKKYSCPIVPAQNHLNTQILAGVKAFK
jgi:uncharacterized protein (DUF1684 family)